MKSLRRDEINNPVEVVGEQEAIGTHIQDAAGTAFDGMADGESHDERPGMAIVGSESHDTIASADMRMAGAMQGDQERVSENMAGVVKISQPERRAMRSEGGVDRRDF